MTLRERLDRRAFLMGAGTAAAMSALPAGAMAMAGANDRTDYVVEVAQAPEPGAPTHTIKFAVIGINHSHISGIVQAVQRGGGELVSVYAKEPDLVANFQKHFPQVKVARSEAEILEDPSIQLIASSITPVERAPLGIRVMQHGKDYLSDKPGLTTLEQLAEVRGVQAETKRIYGILYSGRLESKAALKAGELVKAGAIGRVIQTLNLAPHRIGSGRPSWFWDPVKSGSILCDLGSHQADDFLFYTGSTSAEVVSAQVANVHHKDIPAFRDFGDAMVCGNGGAGYFRVDWFTPDALRAFGDERLFLLGTDGYIELRNDIDIAGHKGAEHLFLVNQKQVVYIDCNNLTLPFGAQLVSDVVNRTQTAQNQHEAFLAAELTLKAEKIAKLRTFEEGLPQPLP
ncbi:MAG: Gfo/Idh/MocA family oxidoreductase [Acidobacteriaceae bacterium]